MTIEKPKSEPTLSENAQEVLRLLSEALANDEDRATLDPSVVTAWEEEKARGAKEPIKAAITHLEKAGVYPEVAIEFKKYLAAKKRSKKPAPRKRQEDVTKPSEEVKTEVVTVKETLDPEKIEEIHKILEARYHFDETEAPEETAVEEKTEVVEETVSEPATVEEIKTPLKPIASRYEGILQSVLVIENTVNGTNHSSLKELFDALPERKDLYSDMIAGEDGSEILFASTAEDDKKIMDIANNVVEQYNKNISS